MASWRDTYKKPRLFMIDARIAYVLLPTLLHVRWWTVLTALAVAGTFYYVEIRRGLHLEAALRLARWWFAGDERPARNPSRMRRMADYG